MTVPAPIVIAYDDGSRLHDVPGHPETAQRLRAITERLVADPGLRSLPATVVHDPDPSSC